MPEPLLSECKPREARHAIVEFALRREERLARDDRAFKAELHALEELILDAVKRGPADSVGLRRAGNLSATNAWKTLVRWEIHGQGR